MLHLGLRLQHRVLPLPELRLGGLQFIGGPLYLPLRLLQGPGRLLQLLLQAGALGVQPLQLVGPAEDPGAAAGGAAGHGASRIEHLAVQGDDPESIAIPPGGRDGRVQILHHRHAPQQIGKYRPVPGIKLDQLVRHPNKARLPGQAPRLPQLAGPDGTEGQDGGPASVPPLQILDDGLSVLLTVHHQVLHRTPQCGLNGHCIPVRHMEQSGHWAVDVVQGPPLDLSHDQLDRLGVPLVEFLHLGEHPDPGGQGVFVHFKADMALSGLLRLLFPPVQPQGIARDHIFHCVLLLLRLPQLLLCGGGFRSRLLLPPVQPAELLAHRLVPVQHLLGGGSQGGQQGLGLMGIGCLDRLLPPQLLQFLSQSSRRAQGLLGGGVLLLRLFSGPFQLLVDLCQTGAPL